MSQNSKKLIAALKRKRETEGFSIRKLSATIGVSFSTLARIERGDGEPDNNTRIRIIEWLGKDADESGLQFDNVALVHFRARKNIDSKSIDCLLQIANILKSQHDYSWSNSEKQASGNSDNFEAPPVIIRSKPEMEHMAQSFRKDLKLKDLDKLDPLKLSIEGVDTLGIRDVPELSSRCIKHLEEAGSNDWSAMSVPLDEYNDAWAIVLNKKHPIPRQNVTFLEECWHILLGHKLTKIAKIANAYGRTFEQNEEHDAYYLAAASLLPEKIVKEAVLSKHDINELAESYGCSPELVEYRIKRLGLWREYKGKNIKLSDPKE